MLDHVIFWSKPSKGFPSQWNESVREIPCWGAGNAQASVQGRGPRDIRMWEDTQLCDQDCPAHAHPYSYYIYMRLNDFNMLLYTMSHLTLINFYKIGTMPTERSFTVTKQVEGLGQDHMFYSPHSPFCGWWGRTFTSEAGCFELSDLRA